MANIDNLNFKVIIDDKDFNTRVKADIELAKKLNVELSNLLQAKVKVNSISAQEAASAKRASDILTKQAVDQEKISQAKAKTAEAEEKVATQAAKTTKELEKANAATSQTAVNVQRLATETQRTAAATNQAAVNEQRLRTETQRTATETQRTATATQNAANATARAELAQRRLRDYSSQTTRHIQAQSRILNELKGYALGYFSVHGASQLLSSLVRVTGEFELQKTTLSAMLGDLNQAEQIITRIQGLAVESPFQFKELTTYAKQLSAFSVPAQELYDTTKMLADISAGLGVGMDRIVLAYGQVRSAAFLRGQEVRQFTEAGIPILDELAKQFSELEGRVVSTGEVFDKISARLVPFEMVAKVFKDMTSEGGTFYNMQEVQAETLRGKISNLKDAYEVMLNEIGKGQSENLKGAVDWARKLMQNYEQTGRTLVELMAAYGAYKVALLVVNNVQYTLARNLVVLRNAYKSLSAMFAMNPYTLLAAGITAVGLGIYKASTSLKDYEKIQRAVVDTQEDYTASIATETTKLDSLYAKLRVAKKGTEEYAKAKKAIYTQYASYISDLKTEGKEVENLASIYNDLKEKIEESAKAKYRATAAQNVENEYATAMDAFYKRFELLSTNMGNTLKRKLMEVEKEALWQYLLGDETALDIPEAQGIRGIAKDMRPSGYGYLIKKAQAEAKDIIDTYTKAKERIDALFGNDPLLGGEESPFVYPEPPADENDPTKKIQAEIDAVRRLKEVYDTLSPYMNGEMLKKTLTALFPNADQDLIRSLDFRAKLVELAAELNKFDQDASQKLLDSISGEKAGEIVSAFKAVETYKSMLDKWLGEDFNLTGEGTSFEISKIIRDLNNQYAKINQKAIQASDLLAKAQMGDEAALATVREVYGEEVWQKYLINGQNVIDQLAEKEREESRKTAQEKINALVGGYVKSATSDLNLKDWGDKSIWQVRKIKEAFDEINNAEINLPDSLKQDIANAGLNIDTFVTKVKEAFASISEEIDDEMLKKIVSLGKLIGEQVVEIASSLKELGSASGNEDISSLANTISELADSFGSIIDGFKSGGVIGGVVAGVTTLATKIIDAVTAQERLARAIEETATQQRILNSEYAIMEGVEGIFGEDSFRKFTNAYEEATEAYKDVQKDLGRNNKLLGGTENDTKGIAAGAGMAGGAAIGAAVGSIFPIIGTAIGAGLGALIGGIVGGVVDVTSEADNYAKTLQEMADEINAPLINEETGAYNLDALKAIKDTYTDLSEADKVWLDSAIANTEMYENALTTMAEYMSSIFGSVADEMSEAFINSFKKSGEAALEYEDIMDDVASNIAKSVIKSVLLQNAFSEDMEKDAAKKLASGDVAGAVSVVEGGMEAAKKLAPYIQELLQSIEPYLDMGEESTATDLGEGIKGITEDQANLIASYLNAMRADVSVMRGIQVKYLPAIGESMPTIMEHLAKIEANTFNSSQSTQAILSELRGLITTEPGYTSLRVYS